VLSLGCSHSFAHLAPLGHESLVPCTYLHTKLKPSPFEPQPSIRHLAILSKAFVGTSCHSTKNFTAITTTRIVSDQVLTQLSRSIDTNAAQPAPCALHHLFATQNCFTPKMALANPCLMDLPPDLILEICKFVSFIYNDANFTHLESNV
jgi:hypothetical protein